MDPRTKDAMRAIPIKLEDFEKRLASVEELMDAIFKLVRSTNESIVRKKKSKKNES